MNEIKHCQCEACKHGVIHESDCAVHNSPALPAGECNCAVSAALDMAAILEIIADDADAGEILMTSGVRMALDAALIKAGRKKAPVRTGE